MSMLHLSELATIVAGRLHGDDVVFDGVSTDTRTLRAGDLFVALRGPNFDGHDYLDMARARGAVGALVERDGTGGLPAVVVDDVLRGLGALGRAWRERCHARLIAVTGSNGKTTLKEMLAAILARHASVLATRGNLNNDIGVPLTLSRLRDEAFAVIEMGANHPGEIDYLTRLAQPDVVVLNNAGRAHLEGFGSVEGVARAKAEIVNGLHADGVFVFNADDAFAPLWRELGARFTQRTFGVEQAADVSSPRDQYRVVWDDHRFQARFPVHCKQGDIELNLQLAGEHNRMNALAAITAALAVGADLAQAASAVAALVPVPGRLCPLAGINGARLVDDSYNANPDSVIAALRVLASAPGRRTLVLGDLAELGEDAVALHRQLGERASESGIDRLLTVGELSAHAAEAFAGSHQQFTTREELTAQLHKELSQDDSVLIKGSRSARMDEVVRRLQDVEVAC
ncbi:MAG: UDP-N-acetylmuramoyl-tripeptide--D-alanyl-D-alanine ligase [Gammaproteobacteria bacterium]|nr:UDP-N-acetylmuramoyl-tripeptide--D-alanyl-D-alanine ligase [Gammaproteobacteria bacterium]